MIDGLQDETRLILKAKLVPVVGSTFQPTGFPDLGPAEFDRPLGDGKVQKRLLVESVQSLANHLESGAWDSLEQQPSEVLTRLPYVQVLDKDSRFLTSSRIEPHRLAGAYIKTASIDGTPAGAWMIDRLAVEQGVPTDWREVYSGLFNIDPLSLIHGVFFSDAQWKQFGNPRVRRAITAVIEAHDARPVVSGGVKRDDVNQTNRKGAGSAEGFGFIPFGRTEYTAEQIELSIAIDLEQIRGYGLGEAETSLLIAIAVWEVRILLDRPLRLRTACDLEIVSLEISRPRGWELPSADALASEIQSAEVTFQTKGPVTALAA